MFTRHDCLKTPDVFGINLFQHSNKKTTSFSADPFFKISEKIVLNRFSIFCRKFEISCLKVARKIDAFSLYKPTGAYRRLGMDFDQKIMIFIYFRAPEVSEIFFEH